MKLELLYFLCSIFYTTSTSLLLSLLLPFHCFIRRISTPRATDDSIVLYEGTVWHERRHPVHHSFRYSVRYCLIDLDNAAHAPPNHMSADAARRVSNTNGPVFLLTIPPSVGYEQNPLSIFYCYDVEGSTRTLRNCIVEVNNTPWGERVSYLFDPNSDLIAKPLHVSPFMDMHGSWRMKTKEPADNLHLVVSVEHPKLGNFFTASLTAKRVASSGSGDDYSAFFWLMPHKVVIWIYWQAFKLWLKNVTFIQHPKYSNPKYREEAILRDQYIPCCQAFGSNEGKKAQAEGKPFESMDKTSTNRSFTWKEASWPWC